MGFQVKNKIVLVTGANRGIGKAIVEGALSRGAAKVYLAVRNLDSAKPLIEEYGDRVVPIQLDLEQPESILKAADIANDVDVVVSNAGVLRVSNPLEADAIENLQYEIDVNVYGLMRMAQAFAPVLKKNGGGVFAQLNSVASLRSFADFATYCASKAAAYSITQSLRAILAAQGTAVVSVHPGPIDTDMAHSAGLGDMVEPVTLVADALFDAIENDHFHVFPDSTAQAVGGAYQSFAENVVEPASSGEA